MCFCLFVAPILLVANKTDLRDDKVTIQELAKRGQKPIKAVDGEAIAGKIGAYGYLECSARLNVGVMKVFETAIRAKMCTKL